MCFALSKFKNRNNLYVLFNKLIKVAFVCFAALLVLSCGGGGGGGGGGIVAFQSEPQMHNGGDAGGWAGTGGGSFSSGSSDGLLFEAFPPFFSPIDHIDMSLMVNGSPVELTGLNESTPSDVLDVSNGDQISGTAVITLADGTTRNATLSTTTIGLTNKLALVVTYQYELVDGAGNESSISGEYTSSGGISVMDIGWTSSPGGGTNISSWKSDSGVTYPAGGTITGIKGDVRLTSRYPLGWNMSEGTLYRYGTGSGFFNTNTSISVTGGSGTYTAVSSSPALTATVSGSTVSVAVDSTYGSTAGQTVADTATASGAEITITISDTAGSETDVTVRLVDCVESTITGIKLNTANTTAAATNSLSIPASGIVNGISIGASIPGDAFRDSTGLGSITLPNAITTISNGNFYAATIADMSTNGAFSGSSITGLTAPGLRYIGNGAFADSSISSIDLSSVVSISKGAFANCSNLTTANLSSITTLQEYTFANCTGLSNITWYTGMSSVPKYAFYNTGITDLVLPNTITSVGICSFANCTALQKVTFTNDVTFGTHAFQNCTNLQEIVLPNSSTFEMTVTVLDGCSGLQKITATGTTFNGLLLRDSINSFKDCVLLNTLNLQTCSTVSIPTGMLYQATGAVSIKLGSSLSSLKLVADSSCYLQNLPVMTYEGTADQFKAALNGGNTIIDAGYATYWGGTPTVICSDSNIVSWDGSSWN